MDELQELEPKETAKLEDSSSLWPFIIILLIGAAIAVSIFGNAAPGPGEAIVSDPLESVASLERPPRIYTVSYRSGVFSPTNLRIHAGDTVRFKNDSIFSVRIVSDPHPQHDGLKGFDSIGDIPQGSTFTFTFASQGIFGYHNEKSIEETGTIIVK
ncbi:MAG: hypothetical protein Q8P35_01725 [Candidatus Yanofskybacteria bacterium]|nr:hypothetical protein [Candidatus Yanofskybacteria bacterium]